MNRLLGYPDMDDICVYLLRQVLNRAPVSERGYAADTVLTQMIRSPRRVRFWKEVAAWADEGIMRQSGRDERQRPGDADGSQSIFSKRQ